MGLCRQRQGVQSSCNNICNDCRKEALLSDRTCMHEANKIYAGHAVVACAACVLVVRGLYAVLDYMVIMIVYTFQHLC